MWVCIIALRMAGGPGKGNRNVGTFLPIRLRRVRIMVDVPACTSGMSGVQVCHDVCAGRHCLAAHAVTVWTPQAARATCVGDHRSRLHAGMTDDLLS